MKGILWNGKYHVLPGAESRVDSSALNRVQLGGNNRLVIMGDMLGLLPPKTPVPVSDPSLALRLLHPDSEEARLAVQLAFDPSPGSEIQGASDVWLMPVNAATQGSFIPVGVSLGFTSFMYGLEANRIKVKQEDGSVAGKKVSIDYNGNTEVFDNLAKNSFAITYTGTDGSAAIMSVDVSTANHVLTTAVTDAAGDNLSIDLNLYKTIGALVDKINSTGKYTALVLAGSGDLSMQLDTVDSADIMTSQYTATSNLQAMVDTIASRSSYAPAARLQGAGIPPENYNWTYLSGGGNGTTINQDWQDAFDALKTMRVDFILPLSSDPSIHSMAESHCSYMKNHKKERRLFYGGALQVWNSPSARITNIGVLKAAAKLIGSDLAVTPGLGSKHYDGNGQPKLYPAYITAAMYAGIAAGGSPVLPLTAKYLRCLGLEVELDETAEAADLVEHGIAVPIADTVNEAGYQISRQVTTWNQNDDIYRIEFSVGRGADYISAQVRAKHDQLKGSPGTEGLDQTIINQTNAVLEAAKIDGYIRDYDPKKTVLRADNMTRYVDYSAVPVLPVNWIFSTYHLEPVAVTFTVGL